MRSCTVALAVFALAVELGAGVGCDRREPGDKPATEPTGAAKPSPAAPAGPPDTAVVGTGGDTAAIKEPPTTTCSNLPFAVSIDLPEASGATYVPSLAVGGGDAGPALIVVSDSGNEGDYAILDPSSGAVLERGALPLDTLASDDLEGASWVDGELVVITSSGYLRHFQRTKNGFSLSVEAYPIGTHRGKNALTCGAHKTNCAPNYEGLCLSPTAPAEGACAGFVASKAHGTMTCLVRGADGRYAGDADRKFSVARKEALTGCHFTGPDEIVAGTNFFQLSTVFVIENASDPDARTIRELGPLGTGFPEAIAAGPGGRFYRFSDTASAPSLVDAHRCE